MATEDEQKISRLFSRLQRALEAEDDELALGLSQKILDVSRDDDDALHCKLVCLIHLSKFDSALQLISAHNKSRKREEKKFRYEEAYCLYRQDKYKDSLAILSSLPQSGPKVMELSAQIAYRQEKHLKAASIYQQLLQKDQSSQERFSNYYAALACSSSADSSIPSALQHLETMEQCFNIACYHISRGSTDRAMDVLERAETLYRESLDEEDMTEEEVAEEMCVIDVQKGYCHQVQEQLKEAMFHYNSILRRHPNDPGVVAVASNNILVLNRDKDVFDSKKKVKVLASEGTSRKLNMMQKQSILFNRSLFALQINQLEQCRELETVLTKIQPNSDLSALAKIALLYREKKLSSAREFLENHIKSSPGASMELYVVLAQLHLGHGDTSKACSVLHSSPSLSCHVGVASTLASLYAGSGDMKAAVDVLGQTVDYWLQDKMGGISAQVQLVKQVAKFYLAQDHPKEAAQLLGRMLEAEPTNLRLRALLISAYSHYDPVKAEEASVGLPPFQAPAELDITAMEQTPILRHSRRPAEKTANKSLDVVTKEKKKKKRKPRLPKNYDPSTTPDPERWLPLKERSYYRKSRRKGGATAVRGTQGSSAASASLMTQLDASKPQVMKTTAGDSVSGEGEGATPSPKAKPQAQTNKKKGRKKKGGKW